MMKDSHASAFEAVAGNGLLDRRLFLRSGAAFTSGLAFTTTAVAATPLDVPSWSKTPGAGFEGYGQPSRFEGGVQRISKPPPALPGTGTSRTPLQLLDGIITPSGLHFERSHSGVPDIDPAAHQLLIHGLVKRPLRFTMDALARYPMESRFAFVECGGNSGALYLPQPVDGTAQEIHGLVSCSEWTGVRLAVLLEEAGIDPSAKWLLAEGADAASMSRSIPLEKAMDDALLALYQNGERIRPAQGYPLRLLLPGFEGNMQVKWLRRLKAISEPIMTRDETSKYTMLRKDGKSWQFVFPMEVKSVITRPSPSVHLTAAGLYEVSGLAWSGRGAIARVDVSADGGNSWAPAQLQQPVLPQSLTRFRIPWRWNGGPATLVSRALDSAGNLQPTRAEVIAARGEGRALYHCNAMQSWRVDSSGGLKNVYL